MTKRGHIPGALNRRSVLIGGASALALGALATSGINGALALDDEPAADNEMTQEEIEELREKAAQFEFFWSATSPATHLGDAYQLVVTNTGTTPQEIWVRTIIMDHRNHTNSVAVDETVELAPGATRELTAANDYGTANHFSTRLLAHVDDPTVITLDVTVTADDGTETARFNQRAFLINPRPNPSDLSGRERRKRRRHSADSHDDHSATPDATPVP